MVDFSGIVREHIKNRLKDYKSYMMIFILSLILILSGCKEILGVNIEGSNNKDDTIIVKTLDKGEFILEHLTLEGLTNHYKWGFLSGHGYEYNDNALAYDDSEFLLGLDKELGGKTYHYSEIFKRDNMSNNDIIIELSELQALRFRMIDSDNKAIYTFVHIYSGDHHYLVHSDDEGYVQVLINGEIDYIDYEVPDYDYEDRSDPDFIRIADHPELVNDETFISSQVFDYPYYRKLHTFRRNDIGFPWSNMELSTSLVFLPEDEVTYTWSAEYGSIHEVDGKQYWNLDNRDLEGEYEVSVEALCQGQVYNESYTIELSFD